MIEDKIQKAIKPIITMYSDIELELIEKIAQHFNLNEEFINSDYWYIEKLKEMGGFNNETIKLLEKYTGRTKTKLLNAIKDIGQTAIPTNQLNIATQKNALLNPKMILNSTNIQNIIKYSYDDLERSFLNLNKTIEEKAKQIYMDILTQTYVKTSSGIESYQQAILESLDELGNKGISILTYQDKAGTVKNYDVTGTVRRDLLIASRGLAGKVNEEVIKESGNHIVRVSNHFGARTGDGGEDYTNHAWWQEMQFFCWNYDGKATEKEKKLPDFMEHCNYGDVQGIVGINCKHFFTTWYGPLKKDKLDYTYNENEEQYKNTQQQRYLENGVKKWKRKQVIAKKAEDKEGYEKASKKAREWQDRLSTFADENDLKREYTREHIKDYKNVTDKDLPYTDVTYKTLKNDNQKHEVLEQQYFIDENNIRHNVDDKYVIMAPTERKKEVADVLGNVYGGQVNIVPRINKPANIKTPDYMINNEKYDLKQITGKGKYVIEGNLKGKKEQSNNFIIDITNSKLSFKESTNQIHNIYLSKHYLWVNKIFLIKENKILKIYKRK